MNAHFTILADDLSGAADCAVPFARAGFSTEVFLQPELVARTDPSVASVDLNTRGLVPAVAMGVTARALRLIRRNRETVWYRKIDSTLRGNIGPDVLATVKGIPEKRVIICAPAFPETGRTTVQGNVFVNGIGLDQSGVNFGWPTGKSVSDLFLEVGLASQVLSLEVIRSGAGEILRRFLSNPGVTVAVCDAETNRDLLAIAEAGLQIGRESIFVGSAGLAHQLAMLAGCQRRDARPVVLLDKPILLVVGSKSAVSRAQFDLLSNVPGMEILRMPITAMKSENHPLLLAGLRRALDNGQDLAITLEFDGSANDWQDADMVKVLGLALSGLLDQFAAVILTGGETARALLSHSEIGCLRVIDEIEPGITLSIAAGKLPLLVVMKAGAFGEPTSLLNALQFLRRLKKNEIIS